MRKDKETAMSTNPCNEEKYSLRNPFRLMIKRLFNREADIVEESFGGPVYVTDLLKAHKN